MKASRRAWVLIVALSGVAAAQDAPPPLSPPTEAPAPAAPPPRPAVSPRPAPRVAVPRLEPATPPVTMPPLAGPAEMGTIEPAPLSPFGPQPGATARTTPRPLTLESTPAHGLDPLPDRAPASRPARPTQPEPLPTTPAPRRFRLFGRPQPLPAPLPRLREPRRGDGAIKVEPRSDPAADAALKRRVETQVREALGPRLRSVEVRVVDRAIHIRAQAARFWQRRAVRRSIESLPALTGHKATIEVVD
jgi:hypothetical protein